ncbi:MAG: hypothetical protein ACK5S6_02925 [bacterium]|jgi:hypothetical protein
MELMDKDALKKGIESWGKRGNSWVKDGQTLALQALMHLEAHGDIGFVNRLYLAMPKGSKSSAMVSWLLTYGSLQANTDKGTKATSPFKFDKSKVTDVAGAAADPWYDHKPEPEADKVLDLQKLLKAILTKAAKAENIEHAELLEGIRALVGSEVAAEAGKTMAEASDDAEDAVGQAPF